MEVVYTLGLQCTKYIFKKICHFVQRNLIENLFNGNTCKQGHDAKWKVSIIEGHLEQYNSFFWEMCF